MPKQIEVISNTGNLATVTLPDGRECTVERPEGCSAERFLADFPPGELCPVALQFSALQ